MRNVSELKFENVMSVYSGKDGKCCCGCAGKHSYNSQHREVAAKDRGYAVDDEDVNDRMVRKVIDILRNAKAADVTVSEPFGGVVNISTVVGERLYIAYSIPAVAVEA